MQLKQLFSLLSFKQSSILWLLLLFAMLIAQITLMSSIGKKGRTAIRDRMEKTELRLVEKGTVFNDAAERKRAIYKSVKLSAFVSTGLWYGAAFGVSMVLLLICSIHWWDQEIGPPTHVINFPSRRIIYCLLGISLLGLAIRLPRMELSLYNDESFAFRRYIHGRFKPDKITKQIKFHKFDWQQTIWGNAYGNNGAFHSIVTRASHDAWQNNTGAVDGQVGETALRLPALLAGSASIFVIALLAYICLGPRSSLIAAALTALHPWHLRYSTEARPYGLVIFFAATMLLFLILAIREGRWRWWMLFGISQFLCLWSYFGSLYFLVPLNLVALGWILKSCRDRVPRWLVANLLGAILFIQVALPSIPQTYRSLSSMAVFKGHTSMGDTVEILAYLFSGMPLIDNSPANPWSPAWANIGVIGIVLFWSIFTVFLFGLFKLVVSRNSKLIFITLAGIDALIFTIVISNLTSSVNHHWYLTYALPSFIFIMTATVELLWNSRLKWMGPALLAAILLSFTYPFIAYSRQSKEQLHDIVHHVHRDVHPFPEAAQRPLFAAFRSDTVYDPTLSYTPSIADLKKVMQRAKSEGRPLFVEFGYRALALGGDKNSKDLVNFIENSGDFEWVKTFHGLEETQFSHHLYRLKPQRD